MTVMELIHGYATDCLRLIGRPCALLGQRWPLRGKMLNDFSLWNVLQSFG